MPNETPEKRQILLRNVPEDIFEIIQTEKANILQNNKSRTSVSNEEALYKALRKCQSTK